MRKGYLIINFSVFKYDSMNIYNISVNFLHLIPSRPSILFGNSRYYIYSEI